MKRISKRIGSLLLALAMLTGLFSGLAPAAAAAAPSGGDAKVHAVSVTAVTDGSAPWDENDETGNDSSADNGIVRSFDAVTYDFSVQVEPNDRTKSYTEAYIRMEFTLPVSNAQAEFDTAAMGWMESKGSYAYQITDNGTSQTLVAYKYLENGGQPVIPGTFGENLTIRVKGMANGARLQPAIYASVAGNAEANGDGRVLYDENNAVVNGAPYNVGGNQNSCFNGGIWSAEQVPGEDGKPTDEVLVTVACPTVTPTSFQTSVVSPVSALTETSACSSVPPVTVPRVPPLVLLWV